MAPWFRRHLFSEEFAASGSERPHTAERGKIQGEPVDRLKEENQHRGQQ